MGFCQYCGNKLEENVTFCPQCGNAVNDSQQNVTVNARRGGASKQKTKKGIAIVSILGGYI